MTYLTTYAEAMRREARLQLILAAELRREGYINGARQRIECARAYLQDAR